MRMPGLFCAAAGHRFGIDVPAEGGAHLRNRFVYAILKNHIYGIISYPRKGGLRVLDNRTPLKTSKPAQKSTCPQLDRCHARALSHILNEITTSRAVSSCCSRTSARGA